MPNLNDGLEGVDKDVLREEAACFASLVKFRQVHLAGDSDSEPASFHKRWSDILLRGRGHYACEGFRESGKDQIVFQSYLLHSLTYPMPSRRYIVIVASTQTIASMKLRDVTRQFQSREKGDLRLDVYKIVEDSGQAFQVTYRDGFKVRIEAYGKGAAIRGLVWGRLRPDILILNDLQDLEDMSSPATLEKDWNWFLGDVLFLGNSTRIFMIGNNLGENCIIERVYRAARELGFHAEKIPILRGKEGEETSTWPGRFPTDMIIEERENFRKLGKIDVWMRERMCEALAPESRPLKAGDLKYFDDFEHDPAGASIITMVDPAVGEKSSSDYSVVATVAIRQDGLRDVLEIDRDRRDMDGIVNAVFRAVAKWGPQSVGVESVAAQEYLAQTLENEMRRRNIYFSLVRVKTHRQKIQKIRGRLGPLLSAGALRVPIHAEWVADLKEEMNSFPSGAHDDMLDALSMIDDARTLRLMPEFDSDSCVSAGMTIPSHWPVWAAMVAEPEGETVILLMSCSPEGKLYVTDQAFFNGPPDLAYSRYRDLTGGRKITQLAAPDYMWKEGAGNRGRVWAQVYMNAGFRMLPGASDWDQQVQNVNRMFSAPGGSSPKLQVFPNCKRLLWELYNAAAGEAKASSRKSIQALMLLAGLGPRWLDSEGQRGKSGRKLKYPERDVP